MASGLRGEGPKIVQIETRYVETDAINFRDVVQSLTGKNSSTAWIGRNNNAVAAAAADSSVVAASEIKGGTASVTAKTEEGAALPIMMMNNFPFKDFDRLLLELPPCMGMEDTPWL